MGRDLRSVADTTIEAVSIHAPAWGATPILASSSLMGGFNPRARMGRDQLLYFLMIIELCFNPRARMGRDRKSFVSFLLGFCFNPRARMGRDG